MDFRGADAGQVNDDAGPEHARAPSAPRPLCLVAQVTRVCIPINDTNPHHAALPLPFCNIVMMRRSAAREFHIHETRV